MTDPPFEPGQPPRRGDDLPPQVRYPTAREGAPRLIWSLVLAFVIIIVGAMFFWSRDRDDTRSTESLHPPPTTGSAPVSR